MMRVCKAVAVCACLVPFSAAQLAAQSKAESAEIKAIFNELKGSKVGCTKARKTIRKIRKDYPGYTFVFAGRKDATITGIRGCGYAWSADPEWATNVAMENCQEYEVQYGTAGGKRVCQIMK